MNVNRTTVYRQLSRLEEKGCIKTNKIGTEKRSLTVLGKIALLE